MFSGEDFTIDESIGLNGKCDFLLSRSPEVLEIEAPAIVIVEAKKADLRIGFGETHSAVSVSVPLLAKRVR